MDIRYSHFKKLNILKKYYISLILLSTICFIQFLFFYKNNQIRKLEEELNNKSDNIEKCIDIENKNTRTIYENIKLSKYCIDNFGNIK